MHCCLYFAVILLVFTKPSDPKKSDDALAKSLLQFKDLVPTSSSESEESREMKNYLKYVADLQKKYYVKKFKEDMSQEEKDEVKFFQDLYKKIRLMNARNRRHNPAKLRRSLS